MLNPSLVLYTHTGILPGTLLIKLQFPILLPLHVCILIRLFRLKSTHCPIGGILLCICGEERKEKRWKEGGRQGGGGGGGVGGMEAEGVEERDMQGGRQCF